ncbi:LytTR family DNA-binding domain-containing protein [Longimicrobium sp.]|uniref:LytR/AlgR family response regulator transcription factor n=1 Tax=Longimicrobium sp. TaxID=2029185 RepID=UPI002BE4CC29|nr:LytTR family DNA-binding domain-containing protein [Longimicrobium sp.]HSU14015.1 LytTR family DNA-binding domain-containing protein [Longimicrobium sp.]
MSEPMRVVVADDEPLARRRVLRLLREHDDQVDVVAVCESGAQAVEAIRETRPDLVFLDVQMPEMDGFEVLEHLGGELPAVIFVTAHDRYALRAFEVHALDYLLKPFDVERFNQALERGRTQLESRAADGPNRLVSLLEELARDRNGHAAATPGRRYLDWVMVKVRGKVEFLRTADIDWVEAEGNYVRLHTGTKGYLIREKIGMLEERLDPDRFLRVHRSAIVQLDRVAELHPMAAGDGILILRDGSEVKLSRGYRKRLLDRVPEYA